MTTLQKLEISNEGGNDVCESLLMFAGSQAFMNQKVNIYYCNVLLRNVNHSDQRHHSVVPNLIRFQGAINPETCELNIFLIDSSSFQFRHPV